MCTSLSKAEPNISTKTLEYFKHFQGLVLENTKRKEVDTIMIFSIYTTYYRNFL